MVDTGRRHAYSQPGSIGLGHIRMLARRRVASCREPTEDPNVWSLLCADYFRTKIPATSAFLIGVSALACAPQSMSTETMVASMLVPDGS